MGTLTPFLREDLIVFTLYPSPLIVKKNPGIMVKKRYYTAYYFGGA